MSRASLLTLPVLIAAAAALNGGCSSEGAYEIRWSFAPAAVIAPPAGDGGAPDGAAADDGGVAGDDGGAATAGDDGGVAGDDGGVVTSPAARVCSAHGVFAVRVIGVNGDGTGDDVTVPCTAGRVARKVATGVWTIAVHALGADGRFKQPLTASGEIPTGEPVMLHPLITAVEIADGATVGPIDVVFVPQPECGDGVDNDRDGRVDLGDPDCAGLASGARECGPGGGVACPGP